MILDYNDFLIESKLQLLLESKLVASPKFISILKSIDDAISQVILGQINDEKDLDLVSNYFDVSDDNSTLTFISDEKASQMLGTEESNWCKVKYKEGTYIYQPDFLNSPIFYRWLETIFPPADTLVAFNNYIRSNMYIPEVGEFGEIKSSENLYSDSYLHVKFAGGDTIIKEVAVERVAEAWVKGRQNVRVGRLIRGLMKSLNQDFSDAEIENFVNKYKVEWEKRTNILSRFELVSGEDIAFYYSRMNYESSLGELGNSCMASKDDSFFDIYVDNPDVCSLLIMRGEQDDTKIVGRALVWTVVLNNSKKIRMMDRVYSILPHQVGLFHQWARLNGVWHKYYNTSSEDLHLVLPDGSEKFFEKGEVVIKPFDYMNYPYLDTFKYLIEYDNGKHILKNTREGAEWLLNSTSGYRESIECEFCNGSGQVSCSDCDGDGNRECPDCDGVGRVKCDSCEGGVALECNKCQGEGCESCELEGKIDCEDCSRRGTTICIPCDGRGELPCKYCNGDGNVDCEECN